MKNEILRVYKNKNVDGTFMNNYVKVIFNDWSSSKRRIYWDKATRAYIFVHKYKVYKIYDYDMETNMYKFEYVRTQEHGSTKEKIVYVDKITGAKITEKDEVKFADKEGFLEEYDEDPTNPLESRIQACINRRLPVYLYGEAGTGKNYILQKIADNLNLDFYYTNSVQEEYKITGFVDAAGDYHETEFYKAFKRGGLFFLDEIDASIPGVLVLLNAAIANGYFEFPNGRINAHEDFRVVAAGNTCGNGADEMYTGRLVLDGASLDRFVFIHLDYNYDTEIAITNGNKWLVDFIHELRDIAKRNGVRATFSYRCLMMVTELEEEDFSLDVIFEIAIFKGMDKETMRYFQTAECKTKYEMKLARIIDRIA